MDPEIKANEPKKKVTDKLFQWRAFRIITKGHLRVSMKTRSQLFGNEAGKYLESIIHEWENERKGISNAKNTSEDLESVQKRQEDEEIVDEKFDDEDPSSKAKLLEDTKIEEGEADDEIILESSISDRSTIITDSEMTDPRKEDGEEDEEEGEDKERDKADQNGAVTPELDPRESGEFLYRASSTSTNAVTATTSGASTPTDSIELDEDVHHRSDDEIDKKKVRRSPSINSTVPTSANRRKESSEDFDKQSMDIELLSKKDKQLSPIDDDLRNDTINHNNTQSSSGGRRVIQRKRKQPDDN